MDTWIPGTIYGKGDRIMGSHNRVMIAECNGMSAYGQSDLDEPHWPEMEGCTTLDGTVVWKCEGWPACPVPQWALDLIPTPEPPLFEEREI